MLGHVLRSPENSPAHSALCFTVDSMNNMKGRLGRHRISLFQIIQKDVEMRNLNLNNYYDILNLRQLAYDRTVWRNMY